MKILILAFVFCGGSVHAQEVLHSEEIASSANQYSCHYICHDSRGTSSGYICATSRSEADAWAGSAEEPSKCWIDGCYVWEDSCKN